MNHDLENFIYKNIPIVKANRFTIQVRDDLTVAAGGKLDDHKNHKGTVFGGSISTALTLCAWGYVTVLLEDREVENATVVVKNQEVNYIKPVTKDFTASTAVISGEALSGFLDKLTRLGKAKIQIKAILTHKDEEDVLAVFQGEFAVIISKGSN